MARTTHKPLVKAAQRWLHRQCAVVLTGMATVGEEPEALGWQRSFSVLVECKASRSDFQADAHKLFRRNAWMGLGQYRSFCTPPALLKLKEIPPSWWLLEWNGKTMRTARKAEPMPDVNTRQEPAILISAPRRIGRRAPAGVSIRCYAYTTKNRASLGVEQNAQDAACGFEI